MPYRFAREKWDYSDFASGRVFRSLPGRTAFPVRLLADELFQRCLALRPTELRERPVTLYDPVCGGGSLVCTLAFLHWQSIRQIVASDADPDAVVLASRNLALLTPEGIGERRQEIAAHLAAFGKASHAEALQSAERLAARIGESVKDHPLPTRLFLADALDPAGLGANLEPGSIDVVIADVPHGRQTRWLDPGAGQNAPDGSTVNGRLLESLRPFLASHAVVAIVGDKAQRARHEAYAPAGTLQLGKRRATFLTVKDSAAITLVPVPRDERHAFAEALIADYAAWLVDRGDAPSLGVALERARAEIESEMDAVAAPDGLLWSALDTSGATVGWLWGRTAALELPPDAAYLSQILVRPEARRQGHGLAMLAALEEILVAQGVAELHLHTNTANRSAQQLYARAGYELVEQLPTNRHLRKRLQPRHQPPS